MMRAVFLDKDGTLVEDQPPNTDPRLVRFYADIFPALRLLDDSGYALVVVTNQSAIAQGRCKESDIRRMQTYVEHRLAGKGIRLAGFYYCPHDPHGIIAPYAVPCVCRKPHAGLLLQASRDLGIDLTQSWMVGDILHDVEAGRSAGCRTVLVNNGHETEWRFTGARCPDHVAPTVLRAAQLIVSGGDRSIDGPRTNRQGDHS
jgi:D-glycero-D-manno-heptose 1,7-bisphosphate phosphatase